ncbi:MAG: alpha-L-rhamnosidase C-terminal domain-containing protein [Candidatus Coatesbacteria bacterium]
MTAGGRSNAEPWRAQWAWSRDWGGPGLTVRLFRLSFVTETPGDRITVHVSADSRYRLYLDGVAVGRGPLKGALEHYHYETYDLGPLAKGPHVLAAEVRWFGIHSPGSEVHAATPGFLVQAEGRPDLDTPGRWRVRADPSVTPDTTPYANALGFLGHLDVVDARLAVRGWVESGFDDGGWEPALGVGHADAGRPWGVLPLRDLHPRDVPQLNEEPREFRESPCPKTFAPGEAGEFILDAGALTTGYPVLRFDGGRDRAVTLTYGEAVVMPGAEPWESREKGIRDDLGGGVIDGYRDTVILPGGAFVFEPFHWRTFWFIRVSVPAGPEPLTVADARFRFTTYPQCRLATFACSDPGLERMWDVSWRTFQNCAHETYEDCPYYEQFNYTADSRIQALGSLALAGEADLPRRTIRLFRDSAGPDGLVMSRVPARDRQVIPHFALLWILMTEEFWVWRGAPEAGFIRSCLHAVDGVLWAFRERLRPDGFAGAMPGWTILGRGTAGSTYMTALFTRALDAAVRLHRECGEPADAARWAPLAARTRTALRRAWDGDAGLFRDDPDTAGTFRQDTQAMAILAGAAADGRDRRILARLTSDPALWPAEFVEAYDVARALELSGGYDAFFGPVLDPWRTMLGVRLSTWAEHRERTRSDCHAWSAWIAIDFVTTVLGVRPAAPGFARILIAPHPGPLAWARGSVPTPAGPVEVEWRKEAAGALSLSAKAPAGVPTSVVLPGRAPQDFPAGGAISIRI